jgi:hypothetical protein
MLSAPISVLHLLEAVGRVPEIKLVSSAPLRARNLACKRVADAIRGSIVVLFSRRDGLSPPVFRRASRWQERGQIDYLVSPIYRSLGPPNGVVTQALFYLADRMETRRIRFCPIPLQPKQY